MTKAFYIYVNRLQYDYLSSSSAFGDRVESYRELEKSLWTLAQLIKVGHEVTITDEAKQVEVIFKNSAHFTTWIKEVYPDFKDQLDKAQYSKYPNPRDLLEHP